MENQELIKRYIYAVAQALPAEKREDIGRELAGVIEDTLAERGEGAADDAVQVRKVLLELGDPKLLAMQYQGKEAEALIGQPHYSQYLWILRIVLWAAGGGLLLAHMLTPIFEPQADLVQYALESLISIVSGLLSAFAITTLIFAFLHRKQVRFGEDYLESLPELPAEAEKRERPWEMAVGVVFFVLFLLAFAYAPRINLPILADGRWISALNGNLVAALAPLALAGGLLNLISLIVNYAAGRDKPGPAFLDLFANLVNGYYAFRLLTQPNLLSPEFLRTLQGLSGLENAELTAGLHWLPTTILAVIFAVLLFDSGQTLWGLSKANRKA